jgi:hypothetical protein
MLTAAPGVTAAQPAVMATSAARQPLTVKVKSGLPSRTQL